MTTFALTLMSFLGFVVFLGLYTAAVWWFIQHLFR